MKQLAPLIACAVGLAFTQAEPAPRSLPTAPLRLDVDLADVAAVRELPNGHLLITDARTPSILVVDPATGTTRRIGREGRGPNEFARPGGIYYDTDGATSFVLDRSQPRVLVVDRTGTLTGMRSIEVRGVRTAADDFDLQRVDAALHSYFVDQNAPFKAPPGATPDSLPLIRFDVARQKPDTAARLFYTKATAVSTQGRMTFYRTPIFAPADGWAVAPDGSVAIVRAAPYRVDWISATGRSTPGPTIAYTPVAVTAADREPRTRDAPSLSGGSANGGRATSISGADFKTEYMPVKPAFDPREIVVAPDNRLWVARYMPANAKQTVYDVFDRRGVRVDRVAFPARTRVVGFGPASVYAATLDDDDLPHIRKYRLTS